MLELASGYVHSVLFVIRELFVSVNCLVFSKSISHAHATNPVLCLVTCHSVMCCPP